MKKKFIFLGLLLCFQYSILPMESFSKEEKNLNNLNNPNYHNQQLTYEINQNSCCLIDAVKNNDIKKVKDLINADVNLNTQDEHGETALHKASFNNNVDVVRELIRAKADLNIQNNRKETALCRATDQIATELINAGANPNVQDNDGWTALRWALEQNTSVNKVKTLITNGANLDILDNNGYPVINRAVIANSLDITKELLNAGANITIQTGPNKNTILHYAVHNLPILRSIIEEGFFSPEMTRIKNPKELPSLIILCTRYITKNKSIIFPQTMNLAILPLEAQQPLLKNAVYNTSLTEQKKLIKDNDKNIANTILATNLDRHLYLLQLLCNIKNKQYEIALERALKAKCPESVALLTTIKDANKFYKLPDETQTAIISSFKKKLGIED